LPLDAAARARCRAAYESLGSRGFRVLAVATSPVAVKPSYKKEDERELLLLGFLALLTRHARAPRRPSRPLQNDGVRVVVLTVTMSS